MPVQGRRSGITHIGRGLSNNNSFSIKREAQYLKNSLTLRPMTQHTLKPSFLGVLLYFAIAFSLLNFFAYLRQLLYIPSFKAFTFYLAYSYSTIFSFVVLIFLMPLVLKKAFEKLHKEKSFNYLDITYAYMYSICHLPIVIFSTMLVSKLLGNSEIFSFVGLFVVLMISGFILQQNIKMEPTDTRTSLIQTILFFISQILITMIGGKYFAEGGIPVHS